MDKRILILAGAGIVGFFLLRGAIGSADPVSAITRAPMTKKEGFTETTETTETGMGGAQAPVYNIDIPPPAPFDFGFLDPDPVPWWVTSLDPPKKQGSGKISRSAFEPGPGSLYTGKKSVSERQGELQEMIDTGVVPQQFGTVLQSVQSNIIGG